VAYSYVIRSRPGGNVVNDVVCSPATITIGAETPPETPPEAPVLDGMSCSVSVNANNEPVLSYPGFPDVFGVNILRNGGWIVTDVPGADAYVDTTAVPGVAYSYVIRSRPGGNVVNDVACSPAPFTF